MLGHRLRKGIDGGMKVSPDKASMRAHEEDKSRTASCLQVTEISVGHGPKSNPTGPTCFRLEHLMFSRLYYARIDLRILSGTGQEPRQAHDWLAANALLVVPHFAHS